MRLRPCDDLGSRPTDRRLHDRGMLIAVACWAQFAARTEGAMVVRAPGVAAAVFPLGPERVTRTRFHPDT